MRIHSLLMLAASIGAQSVEAQELPDAAGKEIVMKACVNCHEIETVIGSRRTKLGWQQSVDDMTSRGAEGSTEEMDAVVAYLTTYFGKVNVNTATLQDLEKVLGLSGQEAQAIVAYRKKTRRLRTLRN